MPCQSRFRNNQGNGVTMKNETPIPQNLAHVKTGWLIYNPKGNHFFKAYDGNGGYYAVQHPNEAYLFQTAHNAVTMAQRLKGKTTLVARAEIAVKVDFAAAESVKGCPLDDAADATSPALPVPLARPNTSHCLV